MLSLAATVAIATTMAQAASRLTAIEPLRKGEGGSEAITLKFDGAAPVAQADNFPEARQAVVLLKGTELDGKIAIPKADGTLLRAVSVRHLKDAQGEPQVQLTFDLGSGSTLRTVQGETGLVIEVVPAVAAAPEAPAPLLRFSNADLGQPVSTDVQEGEAEAHGQAPAATGDSKYFVPADASRSIRDTTDAGDLMLQRAFEQRVSLDFKDAELQNVIRLIAIKTNLNILMSPSEVRGLVTLKLTNVKLRDALKAILENSNLAYVVKEGGIVRIVPISQVKTERIETRTQYVTINWIPAATVVRTLKSFSSSNGQLQPADEANAVIIKDTPEKVEELSRLIENIDVPEKQVTIEARLVELTERAKRDLGINWSLTQLNAQGQPITAPDDGGFNNGNPLYGGAAAVNQGVTGGNFFEVNGTDVGIFGAQYRLNTLLTFLETRSEANILANPKVVTLNNLKSKIDIKTEVPYISAQQSGQGAIGTVEFKETGVTLEVTPNITNNGYVRMTLKPKQKVQSGTFPNGFGGSDIPIIDERSVESSVIVKDEETAVLGGLRSIDNSVSRSGVPWFMNIPVLGFLFRTDNTNFRKSELVLFVTPHILKDTSLSSKELQQYEQIDYNWDLPDYFYDEDVMRAEKPAEE